MFLILLRSHLCDNWKKKNKIKINIRSGNLTNFIRALPSYWERYQREKGGQYERASNRPDEDCESRWKKFADQWSYLYNVAYQPGVDNRLYTNMCSFRESYGTNESSCALPSCTHQDLNKLTNKKKSIHLNSALVFFSTTRINKKPNKHENLKKVSTVKKKKNVVKNLTPNQNVTSRMRPFVTDAV